MSQENVDLVRKQLEALDRRDLEYINPPEAVEQAHGSDASF